MDSSNRDCEYNFNARHFFKGLPKRANIYIMNDKLNVVF